MLQFCTPCCQLLSLLASSAKSWVRPFDLGALRNPHRRSRLFLILFVWVSCQTSILYTTLAGTVDCSEIINKNFVGRDCLSAANYLLGSILSEHQPTRWYYCSLCESTPKNVDKISYETYRGWVSILNRVVALIVLNHLQTTLWFEACFFTQYNFLFTQHGSICLAAPLIRIGCLLLGFLFLTAAWILLLSLLVWCDMFGDKSVWEFIFGNCWCEQLWNPFW